MSYIEGITPPKNHKTVTETRGAFSPHEEVVVKARKSQKTLLLVTVATIAILFIGWLLLWKTGNLYKPKQTDQQLINSISGTIKNVDGQSSTNTQDQKLLNTLDKQVFPQFSP